MTMHNECINHIITQFIVLAYITSRTIIKYKNNRFSTILKKQ